MEIALNRDVDAPAERVWQIITDLEGSERVVSGIGDVQILAGEDEFGVGTRWRETRTMFGKQATEEMEVTALAPGCSYDVEAESHGVRYLSTHTVEALGDGRCRLSMTFGAEPQGTMARVMAATMGRLFVGATKKALRRDLDDIAAAAEAG